jgi:uridine phosphorylase
VPIYLQPTAPIAPDALLPSDPGDALLIAQDLLGEPRMSNHSHGLWGYHGETGTGRPLTIQATGIGGPSAAIVLRELNDLGVRRAIRIGACAPLGAGLGEVIVAERALAGDGTSNALGAGGVVAADRTLTEELRRAAGPAARAGAVASTDLLYEDGDAPGPAATALGADLESAALLALGARLGLAVAAILVVGKDDRMAIRLAEIASAALASDQERSPGSGVATRS